MARCQPMNSIPSSTPSKRERPTSSSLRPSSKTGSTSPMPIRSLSIAPTLLALPISIRCAEESADGTAPPMPIFSFPNARAARTDPPPPPRAHRIIRIWRRHENRHARSRDPRRRRYFRHSAIRTNLHHRLPSLLQTAQKSYRRPQAKQLPLIYRDQDGILLRRQPSRNIHQ